MALSPEERKRIYEEEKARLEVERRGKAGPGQPDYETSTGLVPNVEGLLCYLGWWVTGLIFFILEQKNNWARFHAAQSLIFFGAITVVSILISLIPFVGGVFSAIIVIIGFIFWIVLMVKAYQGEHYLLPVAGEIAERMVATPGQAPDYHYTPSPPAAAAAAVPIAAESPPARPEAAAVPPASPEQVARRADRQARRYRRERREARIAGGAVAIAFLILLGVFFNFFYQYAAYYTAETVSGATVWTGHPFFTSEISQWLPVLNVTLAVAIVGNFFLMFVDNSLLRRSIRLVMDVFGLATVITLLAVYPFDFSIIPDSTAEAVTQIAVTVALIVIAVGFGIGVLVRLIGLLVQAARSLSGTPEED